jgi:short-subunit dehydrogenase
MKTVLITGASSGIGLSIANELCNHGFRVFGTSRDPGKHRETLPFVMLELDITSDSSIKNCVDSVLSQTNTIDVLINNAGFGVLGTAEETSAEQAYKLMETNFWGAVKMSRAVLPIMRGQRHGKIIVIGSLAGLTGMPLESYYSASKHALEGFFKSLRLEVKEFNIDISMVEPGFFRSNFPDAIEFAPPAIFDYEKLRSNLRPFLIKSVENAQPANLVAKLVLRIIKSNNPAYSYKVGKYTWIVPFFQFIYQPLYEFGMRKRIGL